MKISKIVIPVIFLFLLSLNGFSQIKVNSTGKVGINNTSPTHQLDMDGDFYFDLTGTSVIEMPNGATMYLSSGDFYTSTYIDLGKSGSWWNELWAWSPHFYNYPQYGSDENLKKEIKDIDSVISKLVKLRPVSYKMLSKKEYEASLGKEPPSFADDQTKTQVGLIAQEVQQVFPELVSQMDSNYLGISYTEFIPLLIKGLQEQQEIIDILQSRIDLIETDCCAKSENLKSGFTGESNSKPESEGAKLLQNIPNPFSAQTTIRFEIPETIRSAQLHICNMTGTLLKTITVNQRSEGNVVINANEFVAGMYLYSLVCDGRIIDTKQMLLTE